MYWKKIKAMYESMKVEEFIAQARRNQALVVKFRNALMIAFAWFMATNIVVSILSGDVLKFLLYIAISVAFFGISINIKPCVYAFAALYIFKWLSIPPLFSISYVALGILVYLSLEIIEYETYLRAAQKLCIQKDREELDTFGLKL